MPTANPYKHWYGGLIFPGSSVIPDAESILSPKLFNMYEIPLDNSPNQVLQTTVFVDGRNLDLQLAFRYNSIAGYWVMKVADGSGNLYLANVPLLPGVYPSANILQQYAHLGIGSAYLVPVGSNTTMDHPDDVSLGNVFKLWWSDTPGNNATPEDVVREETSIDDYSYVVSGYGISPYGIGGYGE